VNFDCSYCSSVIQRASLVKKQGPLGWLLGKMDATCIAFMDDFFAVFKSHQQFKMMYDRQIKL